MAKNLTQQSVCNLAAAYIRLSRKGVNPDLTVLIRQYMSVSSKGRLPLTEKERSGLQKCLNNMMARRKMSIMHKSVNLDMKESCNPILQFFGLPLL